MRDKKAKLGQGKSPLNSDFITRLLSLTKDEDHGQQLLTDEEILDTGMVALIAGHDTTSTLLTFMVRQLAIDPATLAALVQGKRSSIILSSFFRIGK
jgi:cytochrome P450